MGLAVKPDPEFMTDEEIVAEILEEQVSKVPFCDAELATYAREQAESANSAMPDDDWRVE